MSDSMCFPDTIEEFIEEYSFKDGDEVYTNGSQLIQVYRIEQALEYYNLSQTIHAKWDMVRYSDESGGKTIKCTNCHYVLETLYPENYHHCPYCGAIMDKE